MNKSTCKIQVVKLALSLQANLVQRVQHAFIEALNSYISALERCILVVVVVLCNVLTPTRKTLDFSHASQ